MSIQERIKHIREQQGLTQEVFASKIGMKRGAYSMLELGKMLPTLETLIQISSKFSVDYRWILEGKKDRGNAQPLSKGDKDVIAPIQRLNMDTDSLRGSETDRKNADHDKEITSLLFENTQLLKELLEEKNKEIESLRKEISELRKKILVKVR